MFAILYVSIVSISYYIIIKLLKSTHYIPTVLSLITSFNINIFKKKTPLHTYKVYLLETLYIILRH